MILILDVYSILSLFNLDFSTFNSVEYNNKDIFTMDNNNNFICAI